MALELLAVIADRQGVIASGMQYGEAPDPIIRPSDAAARAARAPQTPAAESTGQALARLASRGRRR